MLLAVDAMLRDRSSRTASGGNGKRGRASGPEREHAAASNGHKRQSLSAAPSARMGAKIRHLRRIRQLQLKELADLVGCSESMISKMENDRVHPSIVMLHKLVAALETNIGYLFSIDSIDETVVAKEGQRPVISSDEGRRGGIALERLVPYSENFLLQANVHIIKPGGKSDGVITHKGEELGYVIKGEVELIIGKKKYRLTVGDSFHFRSEIEHGYRNIGRAVAKIVWVNTPPTF